MTALDHYYQLHFRGNQLYSRLANCLGENVQTLFLMRLLLDDDERLCQKDICEYLSVPKQTMSRILKELGTRDIVEDRPSDSDGREKLYSLTSKGKKYAKGLVTKLNHIEELCLKGHESKLELMNTYNTAYLNEMESIIDKMEKEQAK